MVTDQSMTRLLFVFAALTLAAAAANATVGSATVTKDQLKLTSVSESIVCGTKTLATNGAAPGGDAKPVCIGNDPNSEASKATDTVGKIKSFIGGESHFCGVDERGLQCWATRGTYERPLKELLATGDAKMARFGNDRVCVPQADHSVLCFSAAQERWIAANKKYKREIPAVEKYGPFADLRDFALSEYSICFLDGESLTCEPFKNLDPLAARKPIAVPPINLPGATQIYVSYDLVCALTSEGLYCTRGTDMAKRIEYRVGDAWKGARDLSGGSTRLCAISADNKPLCVALDFGKPTAKDALPPEFSAPEIRVAKLDQSETMLCVTLESKEFKCSSFGRHSEVPKRLLTQEIENFKVTDRMTCVQPKNGFVECFQSMGRTALGPLPFDGSPVTTTKNCRWNKSMFTCDNVLFEDAEDFAAIKTIRKISSTSSGGFCLLYEDSARAQNIKCINAYFDEKELPAISSDVIDIAISRNYGCAYGPSSVNCWGTPFSEAPLPNFNTVEKMQMGSRFGCAKDRFGFICWGESLEKHGLTVPSELTDVSAIVDFAVGDQHVCAITGQGRVVCWGENSQNQLDAPNINGATSIVASGNTTCATGDDGVVCWGQREGALNPVAEPVAEKNAQ